MRTPDVCFCGNPDCSLYDIRLRVNAERAAKRTTGPGVAEVEELQRACAEWNDDPTSRDYRMADRPPDAVLDPVSVIMLDLENKAKAEMRRRDAVEAALKAEVDWHIEELKRAGKREEAAKRHSRRLVWISCPLVLVFFWLNVWQGWEYIGRAAAWIWSWL